MRCLCENEKRMFVEKYIKILNYMERHFEQLKDVFADLSVLFIIMLRILTNQNIYNIKRRIIAGVSLKH